MTVSSQAFIIPRLLINMGHDIGDQIPISLELDSLGKEKKIHVSKAFGWARKTPLSRKFSVALWSDEPLASTENSG